MFADLENPSFIFWPVGCGDCTTIAIADGVTLQIDMNDGATAEEDDNERIPVVNELVDKLPRRGRQPYLSCFALTHPDLDHVKGFSDLLERVAIGELWFTPRVFWEYKKDLSDDAKAFRAEAMRRVKRTIAANGDPGPGHRIRIIGYDELLKEDDFKGFPRQFLTIPGHTLTIVDGQDLSSTFSAFVHAPFKDDSAGERNETSLALHIELITVHTIGRGLFFGDLAYPTIRRIFDETHKHGNDDRLAWDIHLASHHSSKKVMYVPDASGKDVLQKDILEEFENSQNGAGYIVISSTRFPRENAPGDNPPHIKARNRYEEIAVGGVVCTAEYSTPENMRPIIFSITPDGIELLQTDLPLSEATQSMLGKAVADARGGYEPPTQKVGFGAE